ncbi:hypothetical protein T484DRAFT_1757849 [Baffinella frigidus]|nr:hypothetical protein T484DRAFT_1757849 [Cryptophyta sp. CCMP2293]
MARTRTDKTRATSSGRALPTSACQLMDARAAVLDARELALRAMSANLHTRSAILDDKEETLKRDRDPESPRRVYTPIADAFRTHAIRMGKTIFDCREAMGKIAKDAGFTEDEMIKLAALEYQDFMDYPSTAIRKMNKWDNPGGVFFHSATDFPDETHVERREDFITANIQRWMDLGFCMDHEVERAKIEEDEIAKGGATGKDSTEDDRVVGTKRPQLLRPLCKTFEQVETSLDPLKRMTLFSSRKRCTKQQMKLLRDNLHGDKEKTMKSTLQSFMSTSTSKRFCTQFHEVDCQTQECEYKMPPMLMTITVEPEALKLCVFIPVYWYIIENETGQSTHEYEVLIFPGVEMEFHTLRCDKEDECGPRDAIMTMSVKIIGFEPDKSALNCTPHTGCQIAHNQLVNNLSGAIVALMI